jgi:hypothetical protein
MFSIELMGILIFLVGLIMQIVGVIAGIVSLGIGGFEQVVIYGAGVLTCSLGYIMATPGSGGSRTLREEQNMIAKLMGASVFSVGFFMLLLGLADLLGIGGLSYGFGERVLIYGGGIILCVIGYFMARRLPFIPMPPEMDEVERPTNEIQEGPPPERY